MIRIDGRVDLVYLWRMWIHLDGRDALYLQVFRALRRAILAGELSSGSRLPATRSLARDLGVSRNVVLEAYDQLVAEGYVSGHVGIGTFVASELPEAQLQVPPGVSPPRVDDSSWFLSEYGKRAGGLRSGTTEEALSSPGRSLWADFRYGEVTPDSRGLKVWRRLVARCSESMPFGYSSAAGRPGLRQALCDYVRRSRGISCLPEQVLVVGGSQQAIDLTTRMLLDPGDRVLIEDPHYQGARQIFLAHGARLVGAKVDHDGIDPVSFSAEATQTKLAYVTPSHQFPTGAILPLARRLTLLDWAQKNDVYILEDDYDSEYRYEGRPVEAVFGLDGRGRTIYAGTLSKVLFPAIRLGFMVLPEPLVAPFTAGKWLADRQCPTLEQEALALLISEGHFERLLRRSRTLNGQRRHALLTAVEEHLGDRVEVGGTNAGVHLVLWLRDLSAAEIPSLIERAAERGLGFYAVTPYFLTPPLRGGLLVGYGSLSLDQIRLGIAALAELI